MLNVQRVSPVTLLLQHGDNLCLYLHQLFSQICGNLHCGLTNAEELGVPLE